MDKGFHRQSVRFCKHWINFWVSLRIIISLSTYLCIYWKDSYMSLCIHFLDNVINEYIIKWPFKKSREKLAECLFNFVLKMWMNEYSKYQLFSRLIIERYSNHSSQQRWTFENKPMYIITIRLWKILGKNFPVLSINRRLSSLALDSNQSNNSKYALVFPSSSPFFLFFIFRVIRMYVCNRINTKWSITIMILLPAGL